MKNVTGIGTDIIEIARIKRVIKKYEERFLEKIFTEKERLYCKRFIKAEEHFAGRFAAKEAIFKAFGTGIGKGVGWHDAEIDADLYGKPTVHLSDHILHLFPRTHILLSISHCHEYATATALLLTD